MKRRWLPGLPALIAALTLWQLGCEQLLEPDTKAVADNALAILRALRGSTQTCYEPGGGKGCSGADGVDSTYIDETQAGVRTLGWLFYDDRGTPSDSTDDVVSFRGQKQYLDWNVVHNVWLSVRIWKNDRSTEMAVRNTANQDSSYFDLGPVNRPGGIQSGPAYWTNGTQSVSMVMGIHHKETPDDWTDNYSYLEFELTDSPEADNRFFVHADFRHDHSGSGEIREENQAGAVVATFEWDEFGRGSLVIDGATYPFRWD